MRRKAAVISAMLVLLTAPFTVPPMLGWIDEWRHRPTADFRETDWKRPDRKYRYAVLDHVAAKIVTVFMSESEVVTLLGKPDAVTAEKKWQYETQRPGCQFIDFSGGGLLLAFNQQGKVAEISKNLWTD
jgi:hypothetical protein